MENKKNEEIVFKSKLPDIYIPDHLPLHTYCFEHIADFSSRPCIIHGPTGKIYTYADVELTSRRVAAGLHRKLGIRKGDVIMLCLQNCPEFVFGFLGASYLCAVSTTMNPLFTPAEIEKQARASKAKAIVTMAAFAQKVTGYAAENAVEVVIVDGVVPEGCMAFAELAAADEKDMPGDVEILPDDVVALPYSSGTTGLPKGVMLTHKALVTSVAQLVDGDNPNLYFHSHDVILCVLAMVHIYALNSVLLCALRAGAAILIMPKFEVKAMMELVQKHKVTIAPFVPPIILALAKCPHVDAYNLSSIRIVVSGGAPIGKDLEDAVQALLSNAVFGQGYGMTEGGSVSMCLKFAKEPMEVKSGACGTAIRNAELKVVNPDTGACLPRNQPGEFCIRGKQIMKGYLNDPEATANTIDKQGWLHTGDIGLVDDNDELFIVGRLKELIKYKGFQVAPAEIEGLLINHPYIADAAVVGMKDEVAGEVPVAFIVKSSGAQITEDDIKQYISKQVVFYKRINKVFFVDSIPKLPSGKILRKELRARLANGITTY